MSTIVEHNDVDLRPLFEWNKALEMVYKDQITPVYMRLLGDADMNRARVAALRRSGELRRKLRDMNSDERIAFIRDIEEIPVESMVSVVIVFSMKSISERVEQNLKIKIPKAPRSDAKTEAHEKYQAEIDSYPERRREEHKKLLEKEVNLMKKDLESQSKEELYKKYVASMTDELCDRELLKAFKEWCTFLGTYRDEALTQKFFESFEEFSNLETGLKDSFIAEYSSIELYGDELKKLRQVTP